MPSARWKYDSIGTQIVRGVDRRRNRRRDRTFGGKNRVIACSNVRGDDNDTFENPLIFSRNRVFFFFSKNDFVVRLLHEVHM